MSFTLVDTIQIHKKQISKSIVRSREVTMAFVLSISTISLNNWWASENWLQPIATRPLLSRKHSSIYEYNVSCHLVLSTRRVLATVLTILLQCFLSAVTSLSSASFIPVTSCISSIHFLLGRPLLLLPSLCASIICFSNPSDRITCPKNPSFLLSAVCCSVSSSSIPISMRYFH